jgi:hypothetical protein
MHSCASQTTNRSLLYLVYAFLVRFDSSVLCASEPVSLRANCLWSRTRSVHTRTWATTCCHAAWLWPMRTRCSCMLRHSWCRRHLCWVLKWWPYQRPQALSSHRYMTACALWATSSILTQVHLYPHTGTWATSSILTQVHDCVCIVG